MLSGQDTYIKVIENNDIKLELNDIVEKNDSTFYVIGNSIHFKNDTILGSIEVREIKPNGEVSNYNFYTYHGLNHLFTTHKDCSLISNEGKLIIVGERYDGSPIVLFITENLELDTLIDLGLDADFSLARNKNIIEVEDGFVLVLAPRYSQEIGKSRPWLIKIDKEGSIIWKKRLLENNIGEVAGLNLYQYEGNIILHGGHSRPLNTEYSQYRSWILSINKNGEVLWEHFTDWTTDPHEYNNTHISELIKVNEGWLIARTFDFYNPNIAFYPFNQNRIELWDNNFNPIWELKLGELTTLNNIDAIHQLSENEFIATGQYNDNADNALNSTITTYAIKFNSQGEKIWERQDSILFDSTYGCRNNSANSILTTTGDVIHAGSTLVLDSLENQLSYGYIVKFDSNGCIEDNCPEIMTITNDFNYINDYNLSISPNPTMSLLNIRAETTIDDILIFNMEGSLVKSSVFNKKEVQVDISNLTKGIYYLKINIDGRTTTKNVIKM